jgi:hypothetical protein
LKGETIVSKENAGDAFHRLRHMFSSDETVREHLYKILNSLSVNSVFLEKHADYFDKATENERKLRRKIIQTKINEIESKGGKTNYQDMYEMSGIVESLWITVSQNQKLTESFIEKYSDKLNWDSLVRYQSLSDGLMRKHSDKLNWWTVAYFQKYSEEFLIEFFDEIIGATQSDANRYKNGSFLSIEKVSDPRLELLLKMKGLMP